MNTPDDEPLSAEDARLEAWLARAPLPPASPAFCARVMRAIEDRPPAWHVRLRRFLFAPRPLQWNVAGLAATAGLVAVAVVAPLLVERGLPDPGTGTVNVASVRFEYHAPGAHQVALAGDFSQWQARVPLRKKADGTWVAELPLAPGHYEYVFVVDGQRWVADPHAARYREDGFGNRNAVLSVPSI